jgi:F-type H+-transporting ATPase subunit b
MTLPSLSLGTAPLLNAAAGAVEVDINPTLVLMQLGLVTVLMLVLKPVLFDPLLAVFEKREGMVEGTLKQARDLDDKAADIKLQVDARLGEVIKVASEERDKLRNEAARRDAEALAKTRAEMASILEKGRRELSFEAAALEASLRGEVSALSREVASRVLGREVS